MYRPIDFEYRLVNKPDQMYELVCCSLGSQVFWLLDGSDTEKLKDLIKAYSEDGDYFLSYAYDFAEGPCLMQLGIDIDKLNAIDVQLIWKEYHLINSRWASVPKGGLVACVKEILGKDLDAEHKDEMRNLIITGTKEQLQEHKKEILDYCASDTHLLPELIDKLFEKLSFGFNQFNAKLVCSTVSTPKLVDKDFKYISDSPEKILNTFIKSWMEHSRTAAKMYYNSAYSFNLELLKKISSLELRLAIVHRLNETAGFELYSIVEGKVKSGQKDKLQFIQNLCDKYKLTDWPRTATGKLSTDAKQMEEYLKTYDYISEIEDYLSLTKCLRMGIGFAKDKKDPESWLNSWNEEYNCMRSAACPLGAVTTRYQPKPSAGWNGGWGKALRHLIEPMSKDEEFASLDYSSQELYTTGMVTNDEDWLKAYESNDMYMFIAQVMGLFPKDLPIPTEPQRSEKWFKPYKPVRSKVKGTILGMSYGMGPTQLGKRAGMTLDETKDFLNKLDESFPKRAEWMSKAKTEFGVNTMMVLYPDVSVKPYESVYNKSANVRHILNYPNQALGAAITRKAISLAYSKGIKVIIPIHDEILIKYKVEDRDWTLKTVKQCMIEAADLIMEKAGASQCLISNYKIKVGLPEFYRIGEQVIHEGGEARFKQLMEFYDYGIANRESLEKEHCKEIPEKIKNPRKVKK